MIIKYYTGGLALIKKRTKHKYVKYSYYKAVKKNNKGYSQKIRIKKSQYERLKRLNSNKILKTIYQ